MDFLDLFRELIELWPYAALGVIIALLIPVFCESRENYEPRESFWRLW